MCYPARRSLSARVRIFYLQANATVRRFAWFERMKKGTGAVVAERQDTDVTLSAVDLFSGCGGMLLGYQNAGFDVLADFDYWKPTVEVYRKNFDHPIFEQDLSAVDAAVSSIEAYQLTVTNADYSTRNRPASARAL